MSTGKTAAAAPKAAGKSKAEPAGVVFVGPSGSGKSTLIKELMREHPELFGFSVSHTTRTARPGERNGVHYHFVSHDEMKKAIEGGKFIEHADVHGQLYGTSFEAYHTVLKQGRHCILDIDMQGAEAILAADMKRPHMIWVQAKDIDELRKRLKERGEPPERVERRLRTAASELTWFEKNHDLFDTIIVNKQVDESYRQLKHGLRHLLPVPEESQTDAAKL